MLVLHTVQRRTLFTISYKFRYHHNHKDRDQPFQFGLGIKMEREVGDPVGDCEEDAPSNDQIACFLKIIDFIINYID